MLKTLNACCVLAALLLASIAPAISTPYLPNWLTVSLVFGIALGAAVRGMMR